MTDEESEASDGAALEDVGEEPYDDDSDLDLDALADEVEIEDPSSDMAGFSSCEEALEQAVTDLERVASERNEYLDMARRVQADFENFKRRTETQRREISERANESLVTELLPVLDACEAAVDAGSEDVALIEASLRAVLERLGLAAVNEVGVVFDPNVHDAVLTEPADDDSDDEMTVAEVMRRGYVWNGRVMRAAMVKVRG